MQIFNSKEDVFPENYPFDWKAGEPTLERDNAMVVSDLHIPFYDKVFCDTVSKVAKRQQITTLIIGGDLLDFEALKPKIFPPSFAGVSMDEEIDLAAEVIQHWFQTFDEIKYIRGNHDWRLGRQLQNEFTMKHLAKLIHNKLYATDYQHIILNSGGEVWRITHPKSYRQTKTSVAQVLAGKYHSNVIAAHGHFWGHVKDHSGRYHAIDSGGLFNPDYVEYLHMSGDTTHPYWNQGYVFIKKGVPFTVRPDNVKHYMKRKI